jgi:hypothetical protein
MAALGVDTIIKRIRAGEYDDRIRDINHAAYERSKLMRDQRVLDKRAELGPGVRVRLAGGISPKYLLGWEGEVVSVAKTRATVNFEGTRGRFTGDALRCPIDTLEVIG